MLLARIGCAEILAFCHGSKLPHIKKDTTASAQGAGVKRLFFGCQCSGDRSRGKPFLYLALIVSNTAGIVNDYFAIKKQTKSQFFELFAQVYNYNIFVCYISIIQQSHINGSNALKTHTHAHTIIYIKSKLKHD